jgi:hypothetical protein
VCQKDKNSRLFGSSGIRFLFLSSSFFFSLSSRSSTQQ